MTTKQRYKGVIERLNEMFPNATTELSYKDNFQLLIAVILSAQCTDKRVNEITPKLFERFPTAESMAKATAEDVFPYIKSISYPNSKAKYLVNSAKRLVEVYNGEVPSDVDELQTLNGVGRKTANVMAAVVFSQQRMPVDTHIHRVSRRLGLTNNAKTPLQTELQLMKNLQTENVNLLHHQLLLLGRRVCTARKMHCEECGLKTFCKTYISDNQRKEE